MFELFVLRFNPSCLALTPVKTPPSPVGFECESITDEMKGLTIFSRKKTSEVDRDQGKLSSSARTSALGSQRQNVAATLDAVIQIIQQVTDVIPIPTAKNILIGITSVLLLLQRNIQNKDDLTDLTQTCDVICSTLAQSTKDVSADEIGEALSNALDSLESSIDQFHTKVSKALHRSHVRRLVGANLDQREISGWNGELDRVLRLFGTRVNIISGIRSEQIYHVLLKNANVSSSRPAPPPPPPAMFFGREGLFAFVKEALLRDEDVALIGPGGIGKSCIAKALLNDKDIEKYCTRRFFVTYDGMDPATVTAGPFIDRIASSLGLPMLGIQSRPQIMTSLSLSPVLVVLDNAEVFEDAEDRAAQKQISSIVSDIANTSGVTVMLTSRTTRSARLASWTEVHVPSLDKLSARQYFRRIYHGEISDDDVDGVLAALDFHPLSIHVLAHTAKECQWTGEEFVAEWNMEQIRLLQTEDNKENLGFTIRLSLNSPSVKALGDDALHVLRIISFFPQGINRKHIALLFPSIPHISSLVDTLCKLSLVYRSGSFVTMLAPIRLFLIDTFPTVEFGLLDDIRNMYYDSLKEMSRVKDQCANLIISDHLNIEHLIVYDLANTLENTQEAIMACCQFLTGLEYHKLRPVEPLAPVIFALPEASDDDRQMKAWCLDSFGDLCFALSNYTSASTAYSAASKLFVVVGNHQMAAHVTSNAAIAYCNLGYYSRGQRLIDQLTNSPSWEHIDEDDRAMIHFTFDSLSMYTSHDKADQLFLRSVDHPWRGPQSRLRHWAARMYYGYSSPEEVERNLEPIKSSCMSSTDTWDIWFFFEAMAEAAMLQRKFDTAGEILKEARDAVTDDLLLTLMVLCNQAAVASVQGNYEFARSQLRQTLDTLSIVTAPSSTDFLEMRCVQGQNELYAKNYTEARRLLADLVVDCNVQGNIRTKVKCARALGELESLLGRELESDRYFAQVVELCGEAGVPPELLEKCAPLISLDDEQFPGWKTFLRGRVGQ